jgi:hypothetical protein
MNQITNYKKRALQTKKNRPLIIPALVFCFIILPGYFISGCSSNRIARAHMSYHKGKNEFMITYKGTIIARGNIQSGAAPGGGSSPSIDTRTESRTDEKGALTQSFIISTREQTGAVLTLTGSFQGEKGFPCSPGKMDTGMEMIRVSSGMSKSLLNTGIYSPAGDWTLFFPHRENLDIDYNETRGSLCFFSVTKQDKNQVIIIFKPDYYKLHHNHPYFEPGNAHIKDDVPCGWISWKAYGGAINEDDVKHAADWCSEALGDYGLEYIIIDDGWFAGQGPSGQLYNVPAGIDWTKTNRKFPSGMKHLTDYIHQRDLKTGIWISPFGFSGDPSKQPDYWIRTEAHGEFLYNEWHGYHYCDGSNPVASEEWLTRGVKAQRENGVDLFKLDGMFHVAYEGYKNTGNYFTSNGLTWEKALRMGWNDLYHAAGEGYVLSCWGRVPEIAGIPNAIRIGQDKDSQWIYITLVAEDLRKYLYEHNIIWCDDPDHIVFRDLSTAESRTWATLVGITGTLLTFSDRPEQMNGEKLSIIRKILPVTSNPVVVPLNLFSYESPPLLWGMEINREFDNWLVIANCGVKSSVNEISLESIGLHPDREYTVVDFWNEEFRGVYKGSFFCGRPPHHDSLVYAIKELKPFPWVMSVNRHISQGGVSVKDLYYDSGILGGTVRVIKDDSYKLFIYTHGRIIEDLIIDASVSFTISTKGYCAVVTLSSPVTGEYSWEIRFGEKDPALFPLPNEEWNPALAAFHKEMEKIRQAGVVYLSDMPWKSSQNGWGPVEKDMSNGESNQGDGKPITIGSVPYKKGLGIHAPSEIVYSLNKKYSRFKAVAGIDDETGYTGSVVFSVFADDIQLYESNVIKGGSKPVKIDVDITGKQELRLVVTDAGDGNNYDHADWADAHIIP